MFHLSKAPPVACVILVNYNNFKMTVPLSCRVRAIDDMPISKVELDTRKIPTNDQRNYARAKGREMERILPDALLYPQS
jgi:hypothetical protein